MGEFLFMASLPKELKVEVTTKLIFYLNTFGTSTICFEDLAVFLSEIVDKNAFLNIVRLLECPSGSNEVAKLRFKINLCKVERFLSNNLSHENTMQTIDSLLSRYTDSIPLSCGLDERERQYGDDFLVIAVHYLIDLYMRNRKSKTSLWNSLLILEYGLKRSKFNFLFKLMLVRIYYELGVFKRGLEIADTLEVKQVQYDSVAYLFTDGMEYFGDSSPDFRVSAVLKEAGLIYDRNLIETPDMVVQAFKYGTYSKIPEFVAFGHQINKSIQKIVFHLQSNRILYMAAADLLEMDTLIDNIVDTQSGTLKIDQCIYNGDFRGILYG